MILGDVQQGVIVGAALESMFMGAIMVGAAVPPEVYASGVLGCAFAVITGTGTATAVALALPVSVFLLYSVINFATRIVAAHLHLLYGHGELFCERFCVAFLVLISDGQKAVQRACELVELLGAGEVVDGVIDILNYVPHPTVLPLEPEKINALLGTDVEREEMVRILEQLDFAIDGDQVTVPSWRGDVLRMNDLAEEVARFHGYNNIPCTLQRGETTQGGYSDEQKLEQQLGSVCRACGYDEIITYSFISPTYYDKIRWAQDDPRRQSFKILNSLGEDTSIMRTTTLPSMLEILTRNYNYRNKAARLYELGRVYLPGGEDGLATEEKLLTLGTYGEGVDFYTVKGVVEVVLKQLRAENISFRAVSDNPSYHPGRCAAVYAGQTCVGVFGQVHPLAARNYGVDAEFYCAELSVEALSQIRGGAPVYQPLPKFPSVTRDIAVVCAEAVTVGELEEAIRKGARGLLKEVSLFDVYRGKGVEDGKKSVAFNLVLRADDRSLTSEEADEDVKSILETLKADCDAVLR